MSAELLSEREKETLWLLLEGHDAKSIARDLGLSVHTVNDRLRDARRKLGVSSSRQAARLLAQSQGEQPNFLAPKKFGIAEPAIQAQQSEQSNKQAARRRLFGWLIGGTLMLSFIVAVSMLVSGGVEDASKTGSYSKSGAVVTLTETSDLTSTASALEWLALLDGQNWTKSWRMAGIIFRSQLSQDKWASAIKPVRDPLGKVASRSLGNVTKATTLPGAPVGEYKLIEFKTDFASRRGAVETVVLAKEKVGWKVVGYFIR